MIDRGARLFCRVLVAGVTLAVAGSLSSPASAQPAGTTETGTVGSGILAYPYRVYVPASVDADRAAPLVVFTHGCQTSAEEQQNASGYDEVAEREGVVVLYPDVNAIEAKVQPGPLNHCWQFPLPTNWHRGWGDPAAIAAMTHAVMDRWNIDPERVYAVGMSAGAFMTSILAAAYPDLYAAVAVNAGGGYADGLCIGLPIGIPVQLSAFLARQEMGKRARVVPRLVMGGDSDRGIPPGCADKAMDQGLRTNNLVLGSSQTAPISLRADATRTVAPEDPDGYSSTVATYRDRAGCVIGERWLIHGMDHFWPGGTSDPAYKNFTDPRGPNGAEITWDFFQRYAKSQTSAPCSEDQGAASSD